MKIQLSDHFTYQRLLRFMLPSIVMIVFTSIYGVVDGIFVSNFTTKTAFAAVNLIMPYLMAFGTLGFMIGTGGTALISMTLGMGDHKKANELFSLLTYVCIVGGVVLTIVGIALVRPVSIAFGATGQMLEDCVTYGSIVMLAATAYILQFAFQSFCVAAEKANMSLVMMLTAGICNIVLDALFVAVFRWGLVGAAVATTVAQIVGAVIPLVYFARPNSSLLRLGRCTMDWRSLLKTFTNGSSELMSNLSMNVVNVLYNVQLMEYAGEDGIAAYGIIMYLNFVFMSMYIGVAIGSAPLVGYNYGAQNRKELKNVVNKCLVILTGFALAMVALSQLLAVPLSAVFVSYDRTLMDMTVRGLRIFAVSFLLSGFNLYASSFFTALNNGLVSAVISFMRTLGFQIAAVLLLPLVLELDGVWWSVVAAELAALVVSGIFYFALKKKYGY